MRKVIVKKAFKLEKILSEKGIIKIYGINNGESPAGGCYDFRKKEIDIFINGGGIFYIF